MACGVSEDDLMFSEEEDSEVCPNGQTSHSQLTPAVQGLLNLKRLVSHYSGGSVMQGFIELNSDSPSVERLWFQE